MQRHAAPRRRPRIHPLFVAATLAVTVATAGVAGAAVWRHQADVRQVEVSQGQRMAASAGDASDDEAAAAHALKQPAVNPITGPDSIPHS